METSARLSSPWQLFRGVLRDYRRQWWRYSLIVGAVALPVSLMSLAPSLASDTTIAPYVSLASLVMNVALLWAVTQPDLNQRPDWFSATYYDSSMALLRFILVAFVLAASLLPAVLGLTIYGFSLASPLTSASLGERIILGVLAGVFAIPSLWLAVRLGFALIWVVVRRVRPVAAFALSWQLTRRRYWQILGRVVGGLALILLLLVAPASALIGLTVVSGIKFFAIALQLLASIVMLPLVNLLAYSIYVELGGDTVHEVS